MSIEKNLEYFKALIHAVETSDGDRKEHLKKVLFDDFVNLVVRETEVGTFENDIASEILMSSLI